MTSFLCSQVFELNNKYENLSRMHATLVNDYLKLSNDFNELKNKTLYDISHDLGCHLQNDAAHFNSVSFEKRLTALDMNQLEFDKTLDIFENNHDDLVKRISKLEYLVDLIGHTDNSEQVNNLEKRVYDILNAQGNRDGRVQTLELKFRELESSK